MPRLFTALEIPADVGQSLALLRGGLPGARWVDPDNYHLTLRFIGDVDDVMAREVAYMLGGVRRPVFDLQLDGLEPGVFTGWLIEVPVDADISVHVNERFYTLTLSLSRTTVWPPPI